MPTIGSPRPAETRARMSASRKCVVASTIAFARSAGRGLEDAGADEDAVRAELHAERGVRGRGDPTAVKVTTGSRPFSRPT